MALAQGDVFTVSNAKREVCLFTGVTAPNGQPAAATDGVPCYPNESIYSSDSGISHAQRPARQSSLFVKVVGSGGTVAVTLRLWGYLDKLGEWVPVGTGADTTKGTLNAGATIGETKADKVLHCEPLLFIGHFDRLYVEVVSITGTGATAEAWIVSPATVAY